MSDDPFAEPSDTERTVIRPRPGGRRSPPAATRPDMPTASQPVPVSVAPPPVPARVATKPDAVPPPPPSPPPSPVIPFGTPSGSPMAAAAMPLLQLLARLRTTAHQPDPADLYQRTVREINTFDQRARDAGVPAEQVRSAHYALCVSIDEVVLNTPWGGASDWAKRPLAVALHQDSSEGGKFFELLARLRQTPEKFMPVIEIMYLCLSLGVMGKYRNAPRDAKELDRVRAETCALIVAQSKLAGQDLSPRWQGVAAPYTRSRGGLPVWVVYAAALAVCGALFLWVSTALNAASDNQYARMLAAPPGGMPQISRAVVVQPPPPPPTPPEPGILDRLRASLKADLDSGIVSVVGTAATPVVRVSNRNGFATGRAVLPPAFAAVLERIGTALRNEPGSVQVIAYTDNQPVRTVQFPSNFQLSAARAQAASTAIARTIGDAGRLRAEGRADADAIASNATAEGREQNRRIEIVLHRQD
jgi:type VI secretion system protein ImpK